MKNTWRIKKQDWIILRLLFVLMAIDPTMANLGELQKTMAYLKKRYKGRSGRRTLVIAFKGPVQI